MPARPNALGRAETALAGFRGSPIRRLVINDNCP